MAVNNDNVIAGSGELFKPAPISKSNSITQFALKALEQTTAPVASISKALHWMKQKTVGGVMFYSIKTIKPFWESFSGFDPKEIEALCFKDQEDLNWKTGCTQITSLVRLIARQIIKMIKEGSNDPEATYKPSEEELDKLLIVLDATFTRFILNVANKNSNSDPALNIVLSIITL